MSLVFIPHPQPGQGESRVASKSHEKMTDRCVQNMMTQTNGLKESYAKVIQRTKTEVEFTTEQRANDHGIFSSVHHCHRTWWLSWNVSAVEGVPD
jgi:hypothetical protein